MAYRTTLEADEDIAKLFVYGMLEYGSRNAEAYAAGLQAAFEFLSANPLAVRERLDVRPAIRLYRYRAHHIVYVIEENDVVVIRVLHGLQDWLHNL